MQLNFFNVRCNWWVDFYQNETIYHDSNLYVSVDNPNSVLVVVVYWMISTKYINNEEVAEELHDEDSKNA